MPVPVTEIVKCKVKAGVPLEETMGPFVKTLLEQPGCRMVRWATTAEDASQVRCFIDWDSVAHHQAFIDDAASYGPFVAHVLAGIEDLSLFHAALQPFPPAVLDQGAGAAKPVVELVQVFFDAAALTDGDMDAHAAAFRAFIDYLLAADVPGMGHQASIGWVVEQLDRRGEKVSCFVMAAGWDSVEAHKVYAEGEQLQAQLKKLSELKGFKEIEIVHVSNRVFRRGEGSD